MQEEKTTQLILRAKKGDSAAFEQLIRMFHLDMYKIASAILMNDEDAADAMQDAIFACWENLESLKNLKYFKTWLIRILINKCYRIFNSRIPQTSFEEIPESGKEDSYNLEFKEALSKLSDKYRLVAVLYYCEGYRTKEIAMMMNLSDAAVRTRLMRSREILRNYYEEEK